MFTFLAILLALWGVITLRNVLQPRTIGDSTIARIVGWVWAAGMFTAAYFLATAPAL